MNLVTYTTLFPNCMQPNNGVFIYNRMAAVLLSHAKSIRVVAPVPFFPPLERLKRWYHFSQVPSFECLSPFHVNHPRYLVTPKVGMSLYWLSMALSSYPVMRKLHATTPIDLIDAHYVYPDGLAAIVLGKILGVPVVVSARGTDVNLYPKLRLIRSLVGYSLREAAQLISVCSSLKDIMVGLGCPSAKIHTIPNGIDPDRFYRYGKSEGKAKLGLGSGRMLLSVGALIERKGYHLLLQAIHRMKLEEELNFNTYIVGKGQEKENLMRQIHLLNLERDVFLVGEVRNADLLDWYNAADVFFLGSSREGWPNVVGEALACGTPVVATRVHGIPDIVTGNAYGILVDRTPDAFCAGITEAFSRRWDNEEISRYGRSRTWEHVAAEVYSVFSRVLSNRPIETSTVANF